MHCVEHTVFPTGIPQFSQDSFATVTVEASCFAVVASTTRHFHAESVASLEQVIHDDQL